MTAPTLQWRSGRHMHVAPCGEHGQGRAVVAPTKAGWVWLVDMLPGDLEPVIRSRQPTLQLDLALRAAEVQAHRWPEVLTEAERVL